MCLWGGAGLNEIQRKYYRIKLGDKEIKRFREGKDRLIVTEKSHARLFLMLFSLNHKKLY